MDTNGLKEFLSVTHPLARCDRNFMDKNLYSFDCISNIAYIANKLGFSYLAAILDAILDFSARHHLSQFMPAVSYTTDFTEHFDI